MKKIFQRLCFALILIATLTAEAALAAPDRAAKDPDDQAALKNIEYVQPTIENMSKILFRLGILSAEDTAAVDEFARIQHCGLFKEYGMNEVAWSRIRDAQARTIDLEKSAYPQAIEISSGLMVEAYDLDKGVFPIVDASVMRDVGSVSVYDLAIGQIYPCDNVNFAFVPRMHPLQLSLRVAKPINLLVIPATPDVAERYATLTKGQKTDQRTLSLVMRFRILGPDPLAISTHARLSMSLQAELDTLKVYDGPNRNMLIYETSFTPQKVKK